MLYVQLKTQRKINFRKEKKKIVENYRRIEKYVTAKKKKENILEIVI